jgi:hypothetical protein
MRRAVLRIGALLVVAGLVTVAVAVLLEAPFAPWARSFGLWSTLTGDWTGTVETAPGRTRPVFLAIRGGLPRRGRAYIDGRARLCDGRDAIREFEITGAPDNWRGTKFHLSMRSVVEHDAQPAPGDLQGEWDGDEVRAAGALVSRSAVATAEASESSPTEAPPQARWALRRGTEAEFLAACRALTRPV